MSRIGKRPIALPAGVTVTVKDGNFEVKGPKGAIKRPFNSQLTLEVKGTEVNVGLKDGVSPGDSRVFHGTARSHIANAVQGVSAGFKAKLLLLGTGYKADQKGQVLHLSLGLSHPVVHTLPAHVSAKVDPRGSIQIDGKPVPGVTIELESFDKEALGQTVAQLQSYRQPEPYKGKGVNLEGQKIIRKAGKAGKAGKK
jgi:large subunit ribosomal protein L6